MARVIDTTPLPELDRETAGGIFIPEPDPDKGHPIVILQTARAGVQLNVAGPDAVDLMEVANAVENAQRQDYSYGDLDFPGLWFREPQYGQPCYLTPAGVRSIIAVCRGYARLVDPFSAPPPPSNGGRTLHVPNHR